MLSSAALPLFAMRSSVADAKADCGVLFCDFIARSLAPGGRRRGEPWLTQDNRYEYEYYNHNCMVDEGELRMEGSLIF